VAAEPDLLAASSLVPLSRSATRGPATIQARLYVERPPIILLEFSGRIGLSDIEANREFGNAVKSLGGKPFRVLCDFTRLLTMPLEVCAVFIRGQEFAIAKGMDRDAFVCSSSVLRLQFARIARESGRTTSLGPVQFFDSLAEGRAYLEQP
jgi:hypothetical protein